MNTCLISLRFVCVCTVHFIQYIQYAAQYTTMYACVICLQLNAYYALLNPFAVVNNTYFSIRSFMLPVAAAPCLCCVFFFLFISLSPSQRERVVGERACAFFCLHHSFYSQCAYIFLLTFIFYGPVKAQHTFKYV